MRFINPILICVLLSSCSPRKQDNNALPAYGDMGAAEDAGNAK
jgi:hypothetical protein